MPFTPAVGPNYSGIYIPEIWSRKLIQKFYATSLFPALANTDYQGEITAYGDKVIIRTTPTLTVSPYVPGQTLQSQRPIGTTLELLIDQGEYWQAICDDVLKIQSDITLMDKWAADAAEQMKLVVDRKILNSIVPDFHAKNKGNTAGILSEDLVLGAAGAPVGVTSTNIIRFLMDMKETLAQQNVPQSDIKLVIPFWASTLIKSSELKDASLSGDGTSMLRNGRIGMIDGSELYVTNNLEGVTDAGAPIGKKCYNFMATHRNGLTFASQLTKNETLRAESTFGTIMRGLQVYGYKVVDPICMSAGYAYKA